MDLALGEWLGPLFHRGRFRELGMPLGTTWAGHPESIEDVPVAGSGCPAAGSKRRIATRRSDSVFSCPGPPLGSTEPVTSARRLHEAAGDGVDPVPISLEDSNGIRSRHPRYRSRRGPGSWPRSRGCQSRNRVPGTIREFGTWDRWRRTPRRPSRWTSTTQDIAYCPGKAHPRLGPDTPTCAPNHISSSCTREIGSLLAGP